MLEIRKEKKVSNKLRWIISPQNVTETVNQFTFWVLLVTALLVIIFVLLAIEF